MQKNKPVISNSAQCDFFPLAASSADMIVYSLRGSGGSYFSFGIPVNLENKKTSDLCHAHKQFPFLSV